MKIKKICERCGKNFFTKDKKRKYCSKACRMEGKREKIEERGQLCWVCRNATNATGECSWSREFKPVEGWKAKVITRREKDGFVRCTYRVLKCPKFIYG